MDSGSRDEDDRLAGRPFPQAYQHHHPDRSLLPSPTFPTSSSLPAHAVPYVTANRNAVTANAAAPVDLFAVNPDDFYRSAVPGPERSTDAIVVTSPTTDYMASTTSTRQLQPPRPNGNVTSQKAPFLPAGKGTGRQGLRSASAPVEDKGGSSSSSSRASPASSIPSSGQPSVRDLKKRFDQQSAMASGSTLRKPPLRNATSDQSKRPGMANGALPYSTQRTSVSDGASISAKSPSSRSTQQPKFTEDQTLNSKQSFASRIGKPPSSPLGINAQASKSMTHLSPSSSPRQASPPEPQSTRPLLFGEILPHQVDSIRAGYGIEGLRPRRTSESGVGLMRPHQRSMSDPDIEPASPTDWYRAAQTPTDGTDGPSRPQAPRSHVRAHSDVATMTKVPVTSKARPTRQIAEPAAAMASSSSRLPVSSRKSGTPSASPSASRSNSPTSVKRPPASGRPGKAIPSTSANKSPTRSKTPIQSSPPKNNVQSGPATPGNSGLAVYVSTPPPKLSPPLRSSRPRQPVSTATTKSSRMKERSRSPHRRIPPPPPAADDAKRKISIGPVDFAKRRETIKLAYSKSIRESEARDAARRQAAERKRRAKEAAEAAAKVSREEPHVAAQPTQSPPRTAPSRPEPAISDLPLKVTTTFPVQQQPHNVEGDSPTLGIPAIPGGFPGLAPPRTDDAPQSAISDVTNVTEFDNEMQTEPARNQDLNAPELDHLRQSTVSVRTKAVYQYPFEDESPKDANDDTIPIKISVDAPPSPGEQPSATSELNIEQPVPGAYRDDDEYEPQPYVSPSYETTVTIIGRHSDIVPADESSGVGPSRIHDYDEQDEYKIRLDNVEPSTLRHISRQQVQTPASESEAEDQQLERLEEFYVGPYLPERSSKWHEPVREARDVKLSAASSDGASDDQKYAYSDHQRTPDTSHSLSVPSMLTPANRYSQQTVWTDFSIDSDAGSDMVPHAERIVVSRDSAGRGRHPSRPVEVRSPALQWGTEQGRFTQSPDLSPLEDSATTPFPDVSQLPEIDSGAEFRTSYLAAERPRQDSLTVPDLPDHEPPPIPTSSVASTNDYTRPNSSVYDDVRPGSLMMRDDRSSYMDVSRRQSEDFTQSLMTPPSVDKISVEVLEVPLNHQQPLGDERKQSEVSLPAKDGQEKADKERNRLRQRYNIIKEIVDTEMVFVRDMNVVEEIYKGTAEACPKLDNKTIKLIFRNTDEIISFHTAFVASLKEAVSSVYTPKGGQSPPTPKDDATATDAATVSTAGSATTSAEPDLDEAKDRQTKIGPVFLKHMEKMKAAHEGFLRSSDAATKRLIQIQEDKTVKLWLNECDAVAKDLTQAWNLDSLLVKPMQRITKYPVLLSQLIQQTSPDHPDFEALTTARIVLETAILDINKSKKNFELVGQIVGRKRKESDVKAGFARAFGKRVDKLQASSNRPPEDAEYQKLNEKFQDDYLKLQVVLRDVEYYTRQVTEYVHEFLKYLSSMELIMRLQPSPFPEIESRWVQFNVSMRDLEKITLEQHLTQVRRHVIEPFELVIKAYGNPELAMKKRAKRRLDYERYVQLKKSGKKIDKQLSELVEQYEALNETLKKELPKLSAMTAKVGNICLGNLVNIQARWFEIWRDKMKSVLPGTQIPEVADIVAAFQSDYKWVEEPLTELTILNPLNKTRTSQPTATDDNLSKTRSRPDEATPRPRGLSLTNDPMSSTPPAEFAKRHSGQWTQSPTASIPSPSHQFYYRADYYAGLKQGPGSPITPEVANAVRSFPPPTQPPPPRPGTGVSYDSSGAPPRQSSETVPGQFRRDSSSAQSGYHGAEGPRRFSGIFHSALPLPDDSDPSQRSSRASSRERTPINGYNVLWLAASLFEFNIETTKHEAGYPYLTYQAGEIFDVIAEKGELWLAKNQDDPTDLVGWIWSKHFAKLADS